MSLKIAAPGNSGNFGPIPAGTYPAVCTMVVDLGTQESNFQTETKRQAKILLQFELSEDAGRRNDGTPQTLSRRYTASMHEKSTLRRDLKSWRGRDFTEEELAAFTTAKLIGKSCMLSVTQTTNGDKTYDNISGIMGLPKGLPPVSPSKSIIFDMDEPDCVNQFAELPEWIQNIITQSPEWEAAKAVRPAQAQQVQGGNEEF